MTDKIRDIYNAIDTYKARKESLKNNKSILPENKKLFLEWIDKKEKDLQRRKGRDRADQIRYCKTLGKYVTLLIDTDRFFGKDLKQISMEDMERVYDGLEEGRITGARGKKLAKSTRRDFYNKVFKSNFFDFIGKRELARKVFILEKTSDQEVSFFTKKDLEAMILLTNKTQNKLFLYLLFDSGVRVGTALNIKARDFEKRHNVKTEQDYYLVHIDKDYTKSKASSTIAMLLNETNELLDIVLKDAEKDKSIFSSTYRAYTKLIKNVSSKAKIKTMPEGKEVTIHDFRRSCATHLLSQGFSVDFVKKRLGHKPSSTAIDLYINYLAIKEEGAVTQAQDLDYNTLKVAYKQAVERIKVLDENQKQMQEGFELQKVKMAEIKEIVRAIMKENVIKKNKAREV